MQNAAYGYRLPYWCHRDIAKTMLVMKLTLLFLLAGLLQTNARIVAQNVTLTVVNVPLEKVFEQVKSQTGYHFLYKIADLEEAKNATISVSSMPIEEFLRTLLKDRPLQFRIRKNAVVISRKAGLAIKSSPAQVFHQVALMPPMTGRVLSSTGEALAGASVKVKGSTVGVTTDNDGRFTIEANTGQVLVISYVGFQTREITVSENRQIEPVILELVNAALDGIQIIGYGTTTKRLNTGNVTTVKSADIAKQPVSNPIEALHGRVPGMVVDVQGGLPGDQIDVQIRGQNSIGAGNRPLYIVDGIPFDGRTPSVQGRNLSIGPGVGAIGGQYSPLNSINPADIESIEVLKDADATAIYGSRAANGVILITTKKGKSGKSSVGINVYTGAGKVTNMLPVLNTQEYLELRRQAFKNDNVTPTVSNAPDLLLWDQNAFTDFQDLLIGNTSTLTEANLRMSGGDASTRYLMSATYRRETPVFPKETNSAFKRGSFLLNIDHTGYKDKLTASFSAYYSTDRSNLPNQDLGLNYNLPPNFPLYTSSSKDTLYWGGGKTNPLAQFLRQYNTRTQNLMLSGNMGYKILPGLQVKTNIGLNKLFFNQETRTPKSALDPTSSTPPQSSMTSTANTTESISIEPQLEYLRTISKGKLSLIAGGSWQQSVFIQPYFLDGTGFAAENLIGNIQSANTISTVQNAGSRYRYASFFARGNYNWDGKYIMNLTFRRDGSSRFGPDNRYGNFGAVGAAWIFSKENFLLNNLPVLSFGKIRGSYGTVGNDQIDDYGYLDSYSSYNYTYGGSIRGLYPARIPNASYGWEVTKKLEFGLALGFLQDRIYLSASWYRNRSNSMLVGLPVPAQSGFTTMQANIPALIQNKGLELELNTVNVANKTISWKTAFNISFQRNLLLEYPNFENSSYTNTYIVGQPVNIIRAYEYTGIKNGVHSVADKNGDGQISTGLFANGRGDYIVAGLTTPDYFGGLDNNFQYKQWQLDVFFQFVNRVANYQPPTQPPGTLFNYNRNFLIDGVKATATSGTAAFTAFSQYRQSDAVVVDASFIRLKNLALSYNFNSQTLKRLGMQGFRLYLQGQNLLTITDYIGIDPESRSDGMPPIKMLTVGLQCTF